MKRRVLWIIVGMALLALVALVVRKSVQSPMTPRASEAWSRGQVVGRMSVKRPVTLQPASGGGVFLIWSNLDGQLELARIGVDGEMLLNRVLPVETKKARDPQLQVGLDGHLYLLWREQEGPRAGVCYALLEADGTPVGQPQPLSDPGSRVSDAPRLARGVDGRLHALWADDAGIYWVVLDDVGETVAGPTLLIPEGSSPMVQMDDGGRLHLIWQYEVRGSHLDIYYAVLDPGKGELGDPEEIAEVPIGGLLQFEGMALGLSPNTGYVFWSDYNMRFDRYSFQYAFFPLDVPQQKQVNSWKLKVGDGPLAIAPLDGQQSPLPVALSERMMGSGRELELQIALITMGQDDAEEQVVTASSQASMRPVLIADDRSYLHMAWLETGGFGEFRVVYASTAPEVMENYNALTFVDALDATFNSVFRFSTLVVALVAVLIMWAVIPFLGLVIYHLVTNEETLHTVRSRVVLVVVLALEVALTFAQPPRIGVEASWPALRWAAPAVTAVVTAVMTACIVRRRKDMHLFAAYFLFVGVNSLLQLVLYFLF